MRLIAGSGEGSWHRLPDVEQAASGADALLLLLTEWQAFAQIDRTAVAGVMRRPAWLFDARARAVASSRSVAGAARAAGLNVWTLGEGAEA